MKWMGTWTATFAYVLSSVMFVAAGAASAAATADDDEGLESSQFVSPDEPSTASETPVPPDGNEDSVFMPALEPKPAAGLSMPSLDAPGDESSSVGDASQRVTFLVTDVAVSEEVGVSANDARDLLIARFGQVGDKVQMRTMGDVVTTEDTAAVMAALESGGDGLESLRDMLKVERVVYGRIAPVGPMIDVSVSVIHVQDGHIEMGLSRRLDGGVDQNMVMSVIERQADSVVAWVMETYSAPAPTSLLATAPEQTLPTTEVAPENAEEGSEMAEAKSKGPEVKEAEPPAIVPPTTDTMDFHFSWVGLVGATVAGTGLGILAAAGIAGIAGSFVPLNASTLPYLTEGTVALSGAVIMGIGIVIIVADHYLFE